MPRPALAIAAPGADRPLTSTGDALVSMTLENIVSSTEAAGVLDITSGGAGFLRRHQHGYLPSDGDVYVAQKLIQRYRLRTGDEVVGEAGPSPGRGKNPPLVTLSSVHG